MYDKSGQKGSVPFEQMGDATRAGYTTTPPTEFEKERQPKNLSGFWSTVGSDLKSSGEGLVVKAAQHPLGLLNPATYLGPPSGIKAGYEKEKQEGRSLPYRLTAGLGRVTGMVPVDEMERESDIGNARGILGTAATSSGLAASPILGEYLGKGIELARTPSIAAKNAVARTARYPATESQSLMGRPGTVRAPLPPALQRWVLPDWLVPKGELGTATNPGPFRDVMRRTPQKGWSEVGPLGRTTLGGDEFTAGTRPRSLVLTPEEAATEERMQGIAKKRASERGMQFAAGMTPREGRAVPRYPSRVPSEEVQPVNVERLRQIAGPLDRARLGEAPRPGEGAAAVGLTTEPPRTIPEQLAQSNVHLIERMKQVIRNPNATPAEVSAARARLKEMGQ